MTKSPNDSEFTPPRKKFHIVWLLVGFFVLLILLFVFQLFGPDPRIIVSPQTTFITEPLRPNGLPDYEQYVLNMYREGVTPENNAAALLWTALWPGELDPSQYAIIVAELGLDRVPSKSEALVLLHSDTNRARMVKWLKDQPEWQQPADPSGEEPPVDIGPSAHDWRYEGIEPDPVLELALSRPWTSEQLPPLAEWVAENREPFELIVEASRRPRCYIPSPSLLDKKRAGLIHVLLPGQQSMREAGRALAVRAMWHIGEGRFDEARQDLFAALRIARLVGQGQLLIDQLISYAINQSASDGIITMMHHGNPSAEQARLVQRDLASLAPFSGMADSVDFTERAFFCDWVTRISRDAPGAQDELGPGGQLAVLSYVAIDWNVVLRKGNAFYDRMAAAARLPARAARVQALEQIDSEIRQLQGDVEQPATLISAVLSPSLRSEAAASLIIGQFMPAISAVSQAEDRANALLELTRLAAALAVFRAEHGAYPEKLDELVPTVLETLPVDLYNSTPYVYLRDGEGYLLYSAGVNGKDEGGSNSQYEILKGQDLNELDEAEQEQARLQMPAGSDDIHIRVPRPAFELPKPPPLVP